jgi:hypothetical protein
MIQIQLPGGQIATWTDRGEWEAPAEVIEQVREADAQSGFPWEPAGLSWGVAKAVARRLNARILTPLPTPKRAPLPAGAVG